MVFHQDGNSLGNYNYNAFFYDNVEWPPHFHRNFELVHLLRGEVSLTVGGVQETLREGDYALVLSNQIHSYLRISDFLMWIAVFSEDFVPDFAAIMTDRQSRRLSFRFDSETHCAALIRSNLIFGHSSVIMKKACFYAACDRYLQIAELEERRSKNDFLICALLDYIARHFTENITLHDTAAHFGYEYHYLSRLLNRSYKLDFRALVNRYRVDRAAELLRQGVLPITSVAMQSGFQSIRSFNYVFRELKGCAPGEYAGRRVCYKTF